MRIALLFTAGGLGVAGTLAAIVFWLGLSMPTGLLIVIAMFAIGGPVAGLISGIIDRRRQRLAVRGLLPCVRCGQPVEARARRCAECGAPQGGVDALSHVVTRAKLGADERQPCPDCGQAVRFDRLADATRLAPGQHRCSRCGAVRHE